MALIRFRRKKKLITQPIPFIKLLPNIITLLGLIIGVSSMRLALDERWEEAAYCLLIATIIDGIDGQIARFLNATSHFGAELDSLCDFVNFGICPATFIYLWLFEYDSMKVVTWGCVMFFTVCMAIRLARFNTSAVDPEIKKVDAHHFQGIPAPSGALLVLIPIIIDFKIGPMMQVSPISIYPLYINIYIILISLLVASRLPTPSVKNLKVPPKYLSIVMMGFALTMIALYIYTWYLLPILAVLYLCSMPICYYRLKRNHTHSGNVNE